MSPPNDNLSDDYQPILPHRPSTAADYTADARRQQEESAVEKLRAAAGAEIDRLEAEIEQLSQTNRQLRARVQKLERDADVAHAAELKRMRERPKPAAPPPAAPDHTPQLLEVIRELSARKTPIGVKRTPTGMTLEYADEKDTDQ